jgi:hypothetical protein
LTPPFFAAVGQSVGFLLPFPRPTPSQKRSA